MKRLLVVLAIAACGGKSDDCQRLADKLDALPKDLLGKDADRLVTACRKDVAKAGSDPTTKCVLRADSDEEVVLCMAEGWRRESAESAEALRKAEAERDTANAAVAAARKQLDKVQGELDAVDGRVAKAVSDVANPPDRAAIEQAQQRLGQLQTEQQALRKRVVEAREAAVNAGALRPSPIGH